MNSVEVFYIGEFTQENDMLGYIFETTNEVTGKKHYGKVNSVKFMPNFLGDTPEILADISKTGIQYFSVKMIRPCETLAELDECFKQFMSSVEETPVKKVRKKKAEEDE